MTTRRHMRKVLKPYLRYEGVRGFPVELLQVPVALEECRRLAVKTCLMDAEAQGLTPVGTPETAVVKAVNGDRFSGEFAHGIKVSVRCQR